MEIGRRFGLLTVIGEAEKSKAGRTRSLCKCKCGNEVIVQNSNLTTGHTKSCGCLHNAEYRSFKDLSGCKFGRLTLLRRDFQYPKRGVYWLCKCDCGKLTTVSYANLITKNTLSCGCYGREISKKNFLKHGKSNTKLYGEWQNMKNRISPHYIQREDYYDRGINICQEWQKDFLAFSKWALANGYKPDLTLDRMDNNKGYSPNNCRWATVTQQNRNKRNNRNLDYRGETKTIAEWAEYADMKYGTLYSRIRRGWNIKDAIERPIRVS